MKCWKQLDTKMMREQQMRFVHVKFGFKQKFQICLHRSKMEVLHKRFSFHLLNQITSMRIFGKEGDIKDSFLYFKSDKIVCILFYFFLLRRFSCSPYRLYHSSLVFNSLLAIHLVPEISRWQQGVTSCLMIKFLFILINCFFLSWSFSIWYFGVIVAFGSDFWICKSSWCWYTCPSLLNCCFGIFFYVKKVTS